MQTAQERAITDLSSVLAMVSSTLRGEISHERILRLVDDALELHETAIEAARRAGARERVLRSVAWILRDAPMRQVTFIAGGPAGEVRFA